MMRILRAPARREPIEGLAGGQFIGGFRQFGTRGGSSRLDLQPQTEHLFQFAGDERPYLKTAIRINADQSFGLELDQRLAHRILLMPNSAASVSCRSADPGG